MTPRRRFESPALQHTYDRLIGDDPKREAEYEEALTGANVAQEIYDLRTAAGLTQRELAERVGTSASAICRLEDASYSGHSLAMLRRIAAALDSTVEIRLVPRMKRSASAGKGNGSARRGRKRRAAGSD